MELGSDTRGRAGTTVKNTSHGHPPIGDSGMMHHYKLGLRLAAALNSCNRQGRRQRNLVIRSIAIDCPSRMQLGGQVDAITQLTSHHRGELHCADGGSVNQLQPAHSTEFFNGIGRKQPADLSFIPSMLGN